MELMRSWGGIVPERKEANLLRRETEMSASRSKKKLVRKKRKGIREPSHDESWKGKGEIEVGSVQERVGDWSASKQRAIQNN